MAIPPGNGHLSAAAMSSEESLVTAVVINHVLEANEAFLPSANQLGVVFLNVVVDILGVNNANIDDLVHLRYSTKASIVLKERCFILILDFLEQWRDLLLAKHETLQEGGV
jgi:hypothetical protein